MKKLLSLILTLASFAFIGSLAQPSARAAGGKPQVRIVIGRRHRDRDYDRWRYRNAYNYGYETTTETRLVQRGWHTYRETYQTTYLPDGRMQTTLISVIESIDG